MPDTAPPFRTHASLAGVRHGFFGREGGVSTGRYASLNCGPGSADAPAAVQQNRARVARALGGDPAQLLTLYQIHSPEVQVATAPWPSTPPKADALVSATPGLLLGILTADCAPVLFADVAAGVVGAAHAGWKGTHGGVLERTVAAMETLGATRARIAAVVGPTIAQASYEVGPEFIAQFPPEDQARFFIASARPNHHQFDLPAYVCQRLAATGIGAIAALHEDTRAQPTRYFSYRRTTLAAEGDYGRQLSVIGLTSEAALP